MRYLIFLLLFFLFSTHANSQEKRKLIHGIILRDSLPIRDVHIINLKTNTGTISNDFGIFKMPIKLGDSLSISHINFKNSIITITKKNLNSLTLTVNLKEQVTVLKEFTLERSRGIFEQDKDIMTYSGPLVNAKTLHLPYANTTTKVDQSVFKLRSGAVVNLNNLANVFNGDHKRAEILKKLIVEDQQLLKIRKYFTDDFFMTDLQIKQDHINSFLNFCVQKNIIHFFNQTENLRLIKILIKESKSFPQKENSEIKIAFKKN